MFETRGIESLPPDQFYIKRLVGLGGMAASIGDDRHLVLDGKHSDSKTPHFENVYSFDVTQPPRNSVYSGHLNQKVADDFGMPNLARKFPTETNQFLIGKDHYIVMGDNTVDSSGLSYMGRFPT